MQFDLLDSSEPQTDAPSWLTSPEPLHTSPPVGVVCWSKMQAEAGQPLEAIVLRKELERAAGDGCFYWGIGNSLGSKVGALVGQPIPMIFSRMLSKPKLEDAAPAAVFVWTAFVDRDGRERTLPDHVVVTSRAHTGSGLKTHHYALVCHSESRIKLAGGRPFNPDAYRNYRGAKLGPSQVTALLEETSNHPTCSGRYAVDIEVQLRAPYCVRLVRPLLVNPGMRREISAFGEPGATAGDWNLFARALRREAKCPIQDSSPFMLSGAA